MSTQPCRENIAWAAGIFEGEGTIIIRKGRDRSIWLKIKMTDEDVLHSFHQAVLGLGTLVGPYHKIGRKPIWVWTTYSFEESQAVITMLWSWLHGRRKAKALEVLKEYHNRQGRQIASSGKRRHVS